MPRSPSPSPKREHERETQIDLALRRRASSNRSNRPGGDNADTLLDVDAGEIQDYIARKKRERAEKSGSSQKAKDESWGDAVDTPREPPINENDSKRPNILVVERSLDEVILSYLADED